jgi:hypothetical protein
MQIYGFFSPTDFELYHIFIFGKVIGTKMEKCLIFQDVET